MKIAVDAMGGDGAPDVVIKGVVDYLIEDNCEDSPVIVLVGKEKVIKKELKKHMLRDYSHLEILNAKESISMKEHFFSYWKKRNETSVKIGLDLVKKKGAQAMFSAGNTGAVMAISKNVLGPIEEIDRPALALMLPTLKGSSLLMDVGANVDPKPRNMVQFALMGKVFLENVYGKKNPRIAMMNIGEENGKGNSLIKRTHPILEKMDINYIGNIEGRDVYAGDADLIITDGFTGNVALKVSEGVVDTMLSMLDREITSGILSKLGFFFLKSSLKRVKKRLDYSEYGGALLLGVKGLVIIGHGKSSEKAIKNAIILGKKFVSGNVLEKISAELGKMKEVFKELKYV